MNTLIILNLLLLKHGLTMRFVFFLYYSFSSAPICSGWWTSLVQMPLSDLLPLSRRGIMATDQGVVDIILSQAHLSNTNWCRRLFLSSLEVFWKSRLSLQTLQLPLLGLGVKIIEHYFFIGLFLLNQEVNFEIIRSYRTYRCSPYIRLVLNIVT